MTSFSAAELDYLREGPHLGRLATIDEKGRPHVVPLGWRYNDHTGTIDISGRNFAATKKYRNVQHNPNVAFVVDDVLPPWRPRCVMVQGHAEAIDASGDLQAMIRITPERIVSWGLAADKASPQDTARG